MGHRYAKSQIVLHWLTLLMVILTYAAMLLKNSVPDDMASWVKNLHFNFGLTVFLLMFIRLGLRRRYA
ncbi:MAG: cytochrome b, partial [Serratia liquefaciens]|nr:cytochrome b [Serratia liquefaciens]